MPLDNIMLMHCSKVRATERVTNFNLPDCSDFSHLGYECVAGFKCINGIVRDVTAFQELLLISPLGSSGERRREEKGTVQGAFKPWMKICRNLGEICCRNPKVRLQREVSFQLSNYST